MIGGLKPSERQTASIVPRIVAFARCLQFHVSRYVMWCAAAQGPLPNQLPRKPGRRVREREDGDASQRPQSTRPQELIASRGLVEHKLRDPQFVRRASAPPVARQGLMGGQYHVSTWSRRQVADDGRFDVDR